MTIQLNNSTVIDIPAPTPAPTPAPAPVPAPLPTPAPAPEGSISEIITYPISDNTLDIVANTFKSSIMSASKYGSSTLSSIDTVLKYVTVLNNLSSFLLSSDPINGLANNTNSTNYQVINVGSSRLVKVSILLWDFEPISLEPKVIISNGTMAYVLIIPSGLNKKTVEFEFIPFSFVSNFYVRNETGASFSSYGNSIKVQGI